MPDASEIFIQQNLATRPNCGNPLKTLWYQGNWETSYWRTTKVRYGKNPRDWAIRNHTPKPVDDKGMEKAQRLHGGGVERVVALYDALRYSPLAMETLRHMLCAYSN